MLLIVIHQLLANQFFKTQYNSNKQNLENKIENVNKYIPSNRGLVKNTDYSIKVIEIDNKMHNVTNLAATTVLNKKVTVIQNKILDASHFINTKNSKDEQN